MAAGYYRVPPADWKYTRGSKGNQDHNQEQPLKGCHQGGNLLPITPSISGNSPTKEHQSGQKYNAIEFYAQGQYKLRGRQATQNSSGNTVTGLRNRREWGMEHEDIGKWDK